MEKRQNARYTRTEAWSAIQKILDGESFLRDIVTQYGVSERTIRAWGHRFKPEIEAYLAHQRKDDMKKAS